MDFNLKNLWNNYFRSNSLKSGVVHTEELKSPQARHDQFTAGQHNFFLNGLSGGAKYPGGISGDGQGFVADHYRIRQNARTAVHESQEGRALVNRYADTVVDVGLKIEPTPNVNIIGISQDEAETWSEDVGQRFDLYMNSKQAHRKQLHTGNQMMRLYQIQQHRDNDNFVRLYYSNDKSLMSPLQFDFIDPDQIRGSAWTSSYGLDRNFQDGIERDSQGREKKYKIWVNTGKMGQFKPVTIPKVGEKSKRIFMLHGFRPEYSSQGRGFSQMSHALQELQNITDLELSVINKALNQSTITMTVESDNDNPAVNPLEGRTLRTSGPVNQAQLGTESTATGVEAESALKVNYTPLNEVVERRPGSMGIMNLEGKQKLKPFETKIPGDDIDKLLEIFISNLSAASSMPIEVLKMKFGSNYSASRGALILYWQVVKICRAEIASDFMNPLYEMWLSEEIGLGRIQAAGWMNPVIRRAWLNARWIGAPMPNIDPKQTMEADRGYIEMGATTQDRVATELNGTVGRTNRERNKKAYLETEQAPWQLKKSENTSTIERED